MASRLRKTRKLRGSRTHGWGQVGQHRASGHKGGLGVAGLHKYHFSTLLKEEPDHFGHSKPATPHPNIVKKWINVRDLDGLFTKIGKLEGESKTIDLTAHGYSKLLGGGTVTNAYTIKVKSTSESALEKIKQAGGEVLANNG